MRRFRSAAIALAVAAPSLGLASCGEKSEGGSAESDPFTLTLDFYPNPDHAGIYMAQKLGYFEEAGLDVTIQTPSDPAAPIKQVAAGQHRSRDLLRAGGDPGRGTGARRPRGRRPRQHPADLDDLAQGSKIGGIPDLRGKTIATAGIPYQDAYLKTILARAGLSTSDVNTVNVGYGLLPAIVSGRARRCSAASQRRGSRPAAAGKNPVVTPVDQLGVPTYDELVFVARPERLEEDPQPVRLFLAALARGTAAAAADPQAATEALTDANPDLDPKLTAAEVKATLPLLNPPPRKQAGEETARVRRNEPGGVGNLHRLDARPRPDLGPPGTVRGAQQRLPTGQDSQVARARPRGSAGVMSPAASGREKRWP